MYKHMGFSMQFLLVRKSNEEAHTVFQDLSSLPLFSPPFLILYLILI